MTKVSLNLSNKMVGEDGWTEVLKERSRRGSAAAAPKRRTEHDRKAWLLAQAQADQEPHRERSSELVGRYSHRESAHFFTVYYGVY